MQTGFGRALCAALCLAVGVGCATPVDKRPQLSEREKQARDHSFGERIASDFESRIQLRKEVEVTVFLRRVAAKIAAGDPVLQEAPLGVFLINDLQNRWRSFSLPGHRIYLSVGLVRSFEYENELAAVMALELAHLRNRSVMERIERLSEARKAESLPGGEGVVSSQDYFGPAGIFTYSREQWTEAAKLAVSLMYRAGYDPRGLVAFGDRLLKQPEKSALDAGMLVAIKESARSENSKFAPLRNPIVRTDDFIRVRNRMERL